MKKIMFNDKFRLTEAVLEGRKTMTRRIINNDWLSSWGNKGRMMIKYAKDIQCFLAGVDSTDNEPLVLEPSYKVGEIVAIAQAYKDIMPKLDFIWKDTAAWSNKMFVQASRMYHHIRITNIRVERLQDISDEDCMREGILEDCTNVQYSFPTEIGYCGQYPFNTPRKAFAALIDKVSGKGTWKSNPYCFVYEFELVK